MNQNLEHQAKAMAEVERDAKVRGRGGKGREELAGRLLRGDRRLVLTINWGTVCYLAAEIQ